MGKPKPRKAIKSDVPKSSKPRTKLGVKDTPQENIDAMNLAHQEWKTTKQVKYDRDGKRLD